MLNCICNKKYIALLLSDGACHKFIVGILFFLALPESIGGLESLEYLNVFHNHIEVLV